VGEPPDARPGPGARVVSRPSLFGLIVWSFLALMGFAAIAAGEPVGAVLAILGVLGFVYLARARVFVDGDVLYHRSLFKWGQPVRLDRLRRAYLSAFGPNSGRSLELGDRDGRSVRLDATNLSYTRLWPVLAEHIHWDSGIEGGELRKRLAKHWPGPPLGPGE
jgi:hypothetical protein